MRRLVMVALAALFAAACNKAELTTPVNSPDKTNAPATEAKRAADTGIVISPAVSSTSAASIAPSPSASSGSAPAAIATP